MNRNFITEISTLYTSSHTYQIQANLIKSKVPPPFHTHTHKKECYFHAENIPLNNFKTGY